jgi:hypothetical protein
MHLAPEQRRRVGALPTLLAVACIAVLGLAIAPAARAVVAESHITVPSSDPFYAITDEDAPPPQIVRVEGTTDSTLPIADTVNIACFDLSGVYRPVFLGVPIAPDGSFSVDVPATELGGQLCKLRALPSDYAAGDPSAFTGPVTAIGRARTLAVESGPAAGSPVDFFVIAPQLGAIDDYDSLSECGLQEGRLYNADLEYVTTTFDCDDGFGLLEEPGADRSQIQVDGTDAYGTALAATIGEEAAGLPSLTVRHVQDPRTGDLTIVESEPLVTCPGAPTPPATCGAFAPSGVRDERTIEQSEGGRLVTITDRFASTDGAPHALDLLPQQGLDLGARSAAEVAYRFPGQDTFATHAVGDTVTLPASGPGIVYARLLGAADGDPSTGQGAIVYERPSPTAHFDSLYTEGSFFYLHQTVAVPATGVATVRAAYVQGTTAAEVQAVAERVAATFPAGGGAGEGGSAGGGNPGPVPPVNAGPVAAAGKAAPSNRFSLRRRIDRRHGTAKLIVAVPGPGTLTLTGKGLHRVRRHVAKAGRVALPVRANRGLARRLARRHRARIRATVAFRPDGGTVRRHRVRLTLRKGAG